MGMQLGDLRPFLDKLIAVLKEIARNTSVAGCCPAVTSAGSNSSIPAGYSSISIIALSAGVAVTMSDGSVFDMTATGETLVHAASGNKSLPAYTISGGTWKWTAIK